MATPPAQPEVGHIGLKVEKCDVIVYADITLKVSSPTNFNQMSSKSVNII